MSDGIPHPRRGQPSPPRRVPLWMYLHASRFLCGSYSPAVVTFGGSLRRLKRCAERLHRLLPNRVLPAQDG
eukprot:scaffold8307_cov119-Isochrysis_galbana.AAC.4